jgi:gamma-glutamyltranspeptidase / glutathione hydrolase
VTAWDFAERPHRPTISGTRHVVSAGHYLAAQAGFQILEAGGNAIDAGVASGIALNVVEGQMCSFAGVAPTMIYLRESGELVTIDGLGTWPAAASCEFFRRRGDDIVPEGILQSVVPGAPDAWLTALERYGTMRFAEVAAAAIRFARDGYPMHPQMSLTVARKRGDFPAGSEAGRIFLPGGRVPAPGEIFVQADLARTLQFLADVEGAVASRGREAGIDAVRRAFYRGDIAQAIARHQRENGGLLTGKDMAAYRVTIENPAQTRFHGIDVYSCGAWCQGPLLLQALNLVEGIDLATLGHNSVAYIHTVTEAIKLAAADREAWYGDPKFVDVPLDALLSPAYATERRALIRSNRAWPEMPAAGAIAGRERAASIAPRPTPDLTPAQSDLDTSYVCVVDRHGNAFSATPSDGVLRVSPVVPGLGFGASARGIQSRTDPDHPSCIAPGKRPRLTPNPAIAIHRGQFVMPFGTPGGDLQTQAMLQSLVNHLVFGMEIQRAVEAPRFYSYSFPDSFAPHSYFPGKLRLEKPIAAATAAALDALGHKTEWWPDDEWPRTGINAIRADLASGVLHSAADHRRTCYAVGW